MYAYLQTNTYLLLRELQKKEADKAQEDAPVTAVHHTGMNVMAAVRIKKMLNRRR
jgi:hypothetical protein